MSEMEKKLVAGYAEAIRGLSREAKEELVRLLTAPKETEEEKVDREFWETFGSWPSDKSAEEIIHEIRSARHFRDKDLTF